MSLLRPIGYNNTSASLLNQQNKNSASILTGINLQKNQNIISSNQEAINQETQNFLSELNIIQDKINTDQITKLEQVEPQYRDYIKVEYVTYKESLPTFHTQNVVDGIKPEEEYYTKIYLVTSDGRRAGTNLYANPENITFRPINDYVGNINQVNLDLQKNILKEYKYNLEYSKYEDELRRYNSEVEEKDLYEDREKNPDKEFSEEELEKINRRN